MIELDDLECTSVLIAACDATNRKFATAESLIASDPVMFLPTTDFALSVTDSASRVSFSNPNPYRDSMKKFRIVLQEQLECLEDSELFFQPETEEKNQIRSMLARWSS